MWLQRFSCESGNGGSEAEGMGMGLGQDQLDTDIPTPNLESLYHRGWLQPSGIGEVWLGGRVAECTHGVRVVNIAGRGKGLRGGVKGST